jgi:protein SCO1/2
MNTHLTTHPERPRRVRPLLAAAIPLLLAAGAAACSSPSSSASTSGSGAFAVDAAPSSLFDGDQLPKPFTKPDVTLTDTASKPFNLVQGTAGKLTLVYFGYTHCPDVCPTTMATLAASLRALTPVQAARIDVVFVSTDPKRDTPTVLRSWLGQYNPAFIGLTGDFTTIQRAASTLGIDIEAPVALPGGGYTVTHGAEVLAFDPKGQGTVVYTSGSTVGEFDHDIPLLLAGRDE